jgi:crotonobetainyl-CoA:carnitine CoA-transferase CaiB-like acyl-CoA transferase
LNQAKEKDSRQVFEGLRILDFSRIIAGPLATEYFALHGATVVKVESEHSPGLRTMLPYKDRKPGLNRSGYFANYNANKMSLALNIKHPRAKDIINRLVRWCDVIVENFAPGVMEKRGWSYYELRKIKPDLIMLSSSNQGQTGPHRSFTGFGYTLTALSGYTNITGWDDRPPSHPFGAVSDFLGAYLSVVALIAAIDYRKRTGKGHYLDISQYECGLYPLSPLLLDYFVNNQEFSRAGNRDPYAAPHGAYPCQGEDCWCAISVETEEEWESFCRVIGKPEMANDSRFCTLEKRLKNQEDLDALVADWSKNRPAEEIMRLLQQAGVSAGVIKNPAEIFEDPGLRGRGHFQKIEHPEIGCHSYQMPPFHLSLTPAQLKSPAPCLGEHTEYVCRELLGIPDDEFIQLLQEGVFE